MNPFFRIAALQLLIPWMSPNLSAQSFNNQVPPHQHTITLKRWTLAMKEGDSPLLVDVEYDGKLIQKDPITTYFGLNSLKFEVGSIVKIILPPGQMPADNLFHDRLLLNHAIDDGAILEFYQGDKKLNYHTLLFSGLRMGPESKEKGWGGGWNTDTATYVLDGKKYFDGPSTAVELKKLALEDLVIIVLFPTGDERLNISFHNTDKSEIDRCVQSLKEKKVKFYSVGGGGYDAWPVSISLLPK
ncbi:hypothetical protein [Prosthecobacter sp.]|uniref:hypothetical protein n=1 Tax=Prosthecobacter sp. TaxID=1965333 RepID=UPI003783ACA1